MILSFIFVFLSILSFIFFKKINILFAYIINISFKLVLLIFTYYFSYSKGLYGTNPYSNMTDDVIYYISALRFLHIWSAEAEKINGLLPNFLMDSTLGNLYSYILSYWIVFTNNSSYFNALVLNYILSNFVLFIFFKIIEKYKVNKKFLLLIIFWPTYLYYSIVLNKEIFIVFMMVFLLFFFERRKNEFLKILILVPSFYTRIYYFLALLIGFIANFLRIYRILFKHLIISFVLGLFLLTFAIKYNDKIEHYLWLWKIGTNVGHGALGGIISYETTLSTFFTILYSFINVIFAPLPNYFLTSLTWFPLGIMFFTKIYLIKEILKYKRIIMHDNKLSFFLFFTIVYGLMISIFQSSVYSYMRQFLVGDFILFYIFIVIQQIKREQNEKIINSN